MTLTLLGNAPSLFPGSLEPGKVADGYSHLCPSLPSGSAPAPPLSTRLAAEHLESWVWVLALVSPNSSMPGQSHIPQGLWFQAVTS